MKKYIAAVMLFLIIGCGVENKEVVGPSPTIDGLLSDGWNAYSAGDYETAEAKFDSVVTIKADQTEGQIGLGWSRVHLSKFADAHRSFSLAISIEGERPTFDIRNEDCYVLPDTSWVIRPEHKPILGLPDPIINSIRVDIDTVTWDTVTTDVIYSVVSFTENTITVEWSEENIDTLITPPKEEDILKVSYAYYKSGENIMQAHAYCGNAAGYYAEGEYLSAIIDANAVVKISPNYVLDYYPEIDIRNVHLLLAQSYFNAKLFDNALVEVLLLEPTWEYDRDSGTFLYELQRKIQQLYDVIGGL